MTTEQISSSELEDALSVLAEELRIQILQVLWDTEETPVSFSRLREEAGISDSGKFNYHLDKLQPAFVRKRDEGYELTTAGMRLIGAAVSGSFTDHDITVDPVESGECPACGSPIVTTYDKGKAIMECSSCEMVITNGLLAPPVLAGNAEQSELPGLFSRLVVSDIQRMNRGFCPLCGGQVDRSLLRDTTENTEVSPPFIQLTCRACEFETTQVAVAVTLDHPAVIGFLFDHGIDIRETPLWELTWLLESSPDMTSEQPLRMELSLELDDERMEITLDDALTVESFERSEL